MKRSRSCEGVVEKLPAKAARLEIDKSAQTLRALDKGGGLIAFFPITAGSAEKPAPSGELKIRNVARNPTYRYNPDMSSRGAIERGVHDRSWTKQSRRAGLDRAPRRRLRHPWHTGPRESRKDKIAWVHPPDQLGCSPACGPRFEGHPCHVSWRGQGQEEAVGSPEGAPLIDASCTSQLLRGCAIRPILKPPACCSTINIPSRSRRYGLSSLRMAVSGLASPGRMA